MMNDILKQIKAGEVSGVQFKERILDKYDIACELVAFSNSHGCKLVVGIKDKTGETNALSYSEVQETTNLLSDIASENVVPSILIKIDTVEVEDGNLVIATVKEGLNKPYHDNKGIFYQILLYTFQVPLVDTCFGNLRQKLRKLCLMVLSMLRFVRQGI